MTTYTVGFAFNEALTEILLILKTKGPASVVGKLNGIGGKLEVGESIFECQRREFLEEAGVDIDPRRWKWAVHLYGEMMTWEVHFFTAVLTDEEFAQARTMETEVVGRYKVADLWDIPVVPNLRWLIPLSLDTDLNPPTCVVDRVHQ